MACQGRAFRGVFLLAGAQLGEEASTKTQPWLTRPVASSYSLVRTRVWQ